MSETDGDRRADPVAALRARLKRTKRRLANDKLSLLLAPELAELRKIRGRFESWRLALSGDNVDRAADTASRHRVRSLA